MSEATKAVRVVANCRHCGGSGNEADAAPVELEFSRRTEDGRGNLRKMAEAIGRDPTTISKIATGVKAPGLGTAVLIAEYLGVTVERLACVRRAAGQ